MQNCLPLTTRLRPLRLLCQQHNGMHLNSFPSGAAIMAKAAVANGGAADGKSKKSKREKVSLEPALEHFNESAADAGNSKFARALGSSDWTTREKGLQLLTLWLKRRPDITDADLSKIWKGMFFAFWHADKAPVQVWELQLQPGHFASRMPAAADGSR